MTKLIKVLVLAIVLAGVGAMPAFAQKKAPDYKLSKIKIVPYNSATGEFEEEYTAKSDRSFFNDLSISLFVVFEIEGQAGSFEAGRKLQVRVTEGTRGKASRNVQIGLIGENGFYFEPLWLYPSMCSDVKITASIIGQKPTKTMTRTIPFLCGE